MGIAYAPVMPMYMDRHDAPGISPEDVAEAHYRDLAMQAEHGVRYHTYWFDPAEQSVFCLAEGPSKQAVEAVHQEAHGFLATTILELDPKAPLNALFGTLPHHPAGKPYTSPAMRAIVFTDICGSVEQTHRLGDEVHIQLLTEHNNIVRGALASHGGREVKHTGDGIMAAFTSVASAVSFAIDVQRALHVRIKRMSSPLDVSIGISAEAGEIAVSVAVRELCIGKEFRFEDRGRVALKGLPEPTQTYAVSWAD